MVTLPSGTASAGAAARYERASVIPNPIPNLRNAEPWLCTAPPSESWSLVTLFGVSLTHEPAFVIVLRCDSNHDCRQISRSDQCGSGPEIEKEGK
jgi:hypothetical protein